MATNQPSNLRPCPFHNLPARGDEGTCGCYYGINMRDKVWNSRPLEDALLARAERAEAELNRLTNLTYVRCVESERERAERMVERLIVEGNLMAEKLAISRWEDDQPLDWKDLVAEWQARNE